MAYMYISMPVCMYVCMSLLKGASYYQVPYIHWIQIIRNIDNLAFVIFELNTSSTFVDFCSINR